jgi:type II secretory pathway component PulF
MMVQLPERTHSVSWRIGVFGVILGGLCVLAAFVLPEFEVMYHDMDPHFPKGWPWPIRIMVAVPQWGWLAFAGTSAALALCTSYRLRKYRLNEFQCALLEVSVTLFFVLLIGFAVINLFLPLSSGIIQSVGTR